MANDSLRLFATDKGKGMLAYRLYATSILVGTCLIWWYRATHIPSKGEKGRWPWIGVTFAEIFYGVYWVTTQFFRLNPIYRHAFPEKLSQRLVLDTSHNFSYFHFSLPVSFFLFFFFKKTFCVFLK
jgi:hypothetical protein